MSKSTGNSLRGLGKSSHNWPLQLNHGFGQSTNSNVKCKYVCRFCKIKSFPSKSGRYNHEIANCSHRPDNARQFLKELKSVEPYKRAPKPPAEHGSFPCTYCPKVFQTNKTAQTHMRGSCRALHNGVPMVVQPPVQQLNVIEQEMVVNMAHEGERNVDGAPSDIPLPFTIVDDTAEDVKPRLALDETSELNSDAQVNEEETKSHRQV